MTIPLTSLQKYYKLTLVFYYSCMYIQKYLSISSIFSSFLIKLNSNILPFDKEILPQLYTNFQNFVEN